MPIISKAKTIDLGTLNYTRSAPYFRAYIPDLAPQRNQGVKINAYVAGYNAKPYVDGWNDYDFGYTIATGFNISFRNGNIKTEAEFKAAMSGVMLTYETVDTVEECIISPNLFNGVFEQGSGVESSNTRVRSYNTIKIYGGVTYTLRSSNYSGLKYVINTGRTSNYPWNDYKYCGNDANWVTNDITFTATRDGWLGIIVRYDNETRIQPNDMDGILITLTRDYPPDKPLTESITPYEEVIL